MTVRLVLAVVKLNAGAVCAHAVVCGLRRAEYANKQVLLTLRERCANTFLSAFLTAVHFVLSFEVPVIPLPRELRAADTHILHRKQVLRMRMLRAHSQTTRTMSGAGILLPLYYGAPSVHF